jgi:hypothetical protein
MPRPSTCTSGKLALSLFKGFVEYIKRSCAGVTLSEMLLLIHSLDPLLKPI